MDIVSFSSLLFSLQIRNGAVTRGMACDKARVQVKRGNQLSGQSVNFS